MRTIKAIYDAQRDDIADLQTWRALPTAATGRMGSMDPFLFLNHHGPQVYAPGNSGLPFGPHPHRGFATVTFIRQGELVHSDSAGHESIITSGGVQWMSAGAGIVHAELSPTSFCDRGGPLEILQLWVNLPSRLKMTAPHYVGLQHADIPVLKLADARVAVQLVAGTWSASPVPAATGDAPRGPVVPLTDMMLASITIAAGGTLDLQVPRAHTIFCYAITGALQINGRAVQMRQLVDFAGDGEGVQITATADAALLFGHAAPFGEPVVAYGPFVMNTEQEIAEAIRDYKAGRFGAGPA